MIDATLLSFRWAAVEGATGYEIVKDGQVVATTGPKARTSRVSVGARTVVEVRDLPDRATAQTVEFTQSQGV